MISAVEEAVVQEFRQLLSHLEGAAGQGQGGLAIGVPVLIYQDLIGAQGEGLTSGLVVILQRDQIQFHDPAVQADGSQILIFYVQAEGISLLEGGKGGVAITQEVTCGEVLGGKGLQGCGFCSVPCWRKRPPGRSG